MDGFENTEEGKATTDETRAEPAGVNRTGISDQGAEFRPGRNALNMDRPRGGRPNINIRHKPDLHYFLY